MAVLVLLDHAVLSAENAIRELRRRWVVDGGPTDLDDRAAHLDLVRRIDDRAVAHWNGPTWVGLPVQPRRTAGQRWSG